jgi:hypothetical protein
MRTLFPIALFALLALTACDDAPTTQVGVAASGTPTSGKIHFVAGENVIVLHQGDASILIPIDAVIGRAIQVVDGDVVPVTTAADVDSAFIAPCPCCKQGCDTYCLPSLPCDDLEQLLEASRP